MKKITKLSLALTVSMSMTFAASASMAAGHHKSQGHHESRDGEAKNIILMVPDGMGLSNATAARIFKNGPNGDRLAFETLRQIGHQSTHSANSTVTDSAAAASAWAVGKKFVNGEISCSEELNGKECSNPPATILEIAKSMGKSTGLVATSEISHATPAAFGAHTWSRSCGTEIARQYIEVTGVDVVLGGGVEKTSAGKCDAPYPLSVGWGQDDVIATAMDHGYTVVGTADELKSAVQGKDSKVLGLFADFNKGKNVEMFRVDPAVSYPDEEPTLAEMTSAALDILEDDKDGFFLMVEGSQIDWEDHANNVQGQIAETLGFDAAVETVKEWLQKGKNAKNTLVIVAPDHDTAGFGINGPYGTLSNPGEVVEPGWTSGDHTATDVVIWSQGPGSSNLGRALDNTDLFKVMVDSLEGNE